MEVILFVGASFLLFCVVVKSFLNFYMLNIYDFIIFFFILLLRYYVIFLIRYVGWLYYLRILFLDIEGNIVKVFL